MQQTQLEAIAQAIIERQGRYQRNTLLFDQLVQLFVQGRPVAPELLANVLHRELDEVLFILRAHRDQHQNQARRRFCPMHIQQFAESLSLVTTVREGLQIKDQGYRKLILKALRKVPRVTWH